MEYKYLNPDSVETETGILDCPVWGCDGIIKISYLVDKSLPKAARSAIRMDVFQRYSRVICNKNHGKEKV